jgi:hypothetical protein
MSPKMVNQGSRPKQLTNAVVGRTTPNQNAVALETVRKHGHALPVGSSSNLELPQLMSLAGIGCAVTLVILPRFLVRWWFIHFPRAVFGGLSLFHFATIFSFSWTPCEFSWIP